MTWGMVAVAGATVVGGVMSSNAAKGAANSQAASSQAALDASQRQYDQTRNDQQPYRQAGNAALGQMRTLLGVGDGSHTEANFDSGKYLALNPDAAQYMATSGKTAWDHYVEDGSRRQGDFWTGGNSSDPSFGSYAKPLTQGEVQLDPGYQFGLTQGQQGIDRKTAAAGGRISGASLKAAAQYGNDYATTKYGDAYNRVNQARSDRLNRLAALAGIGQTGTQQVGQAGQANANAIGAISTAQGNAAGAAQIAQGNIWGNTGNQLASLYGRQSSTPTGSPGITSEPYPGYNASIGLQ
jgi:hypothetical protein